MIEITGDAAVLNDGFMLESLGAVLLPEEVRALTQEVSKNIEGKDFSRAIELMQKLSQLHLDDQCSNAQSNTLQKELCHLFEIFSQEANLQQVKELADILSKNLSIESTRSDCEVHFKVEGAHCNTTFTISNDTDPEAQALMKKILKLSNRGKFQEAESKLSQLVQLCAEHRVLLTDFGNFYSELVCCNCPFAIKSMSLFESIYVVSIKDNRLLISTKDFSLISVSNPISVLKMHDYEQCIQEIADFTNSYMRIREYMQLAWHQQKPELMQKAREEYVHFTGTSIEHISLELNFMDHYTRFHDGINARAVFETFATRLASLEEGEMKHALTCQAHLYKARVYITAQDKDGFDACLLIAKKEMSQIQQNITVLQLVQGWISDIQEEEAEAFPTGPLNSRP